MGREVHPVIAAAQEDTHAGPIVPPRRIWLCADDYGLSLSINTAIRDLVTRGRLNATSVLVAAPSFCRSEAIALRTLNSVASRVAIGLHLAFTAQFRRRAAACGLRTNPAFAGTYDFAQHMDFAAVFPRFLEGLPDGGLVMCHP